MNLELISKSRRKVILSFAIPSIIAMVLTSMINLIDGFFIGNYVGTEGLAAVNLGLPIVYLYLAIGLLISVGGIAIAGRMLGAEQIEDSNQVFRQTILMCTIVSVALTIVMMVLLNPISNLFDTDQLTRGYFNDYYKIMLFELPLMVITTTFGMFIRGEGNPVFVMVSNIISVLLNAVLDYIFVKPLGLGVKGVALASVIAATVTLVVNIIYVLYSAKVFHFGKVHFDKKVLKDTIFNGSSEFIGEMSMCISMAAFNYVVLKYAGVDGVAAFTIVGYVSYVFSMITLGFGQGIVPLISFSYGANRHDLAVKVRNTTINMVVGVAIVVFIVMIFASGWYCGLFSDNNAVIDMVGPGLKLQMSSFAFAGINTIVSFYYTSIGKAKESAVISASRGLVVLLIAIFTLPMLLGITGVWLVSIVTEFITLLLSAYYMIKNREKIIEAESEIKQCIS